MLLVVHSIKDKGFPSPRAIITSWRYGELSNEELGHHEGRDEDDFVVDVHDLRRAHTGVNPYANEFTLLRWSRLSDTLAIITTKHFLSL